MSAAEILFEATSGDLVALLADAVVTEGPHRLANLTTEQEVEAGAAITDHVRPDVDSMQLEIVISNTPIRDLEASPDVFYFGVTGALEDLPLDLRTGPALTAYSQAGPPAKGPELADASAPDVTAQAWTPDGDVTRVEDSWSALEQARDEAWPATITTGLRTYERMVLLSAETTRTAADGTWIRVFLEFRQIREVATELVEVEAPARPRGRRATEAGRTPTDETDEATEPRVSVLARLFGLGG